MVLEKNVPQYSKISVSIYIYIIKNHQKSVHLPGTTRFFEALLRPEGLRYGLGATFAKYGFCVDASKKFWWPYLIRKYFF